MAVLALVSLFFMPVIRLQKAIRRLADFGLLAASAALTGGLMFLPAARSEARPLAFRPPSGFCPSLRCHAGEATLLLRLELLVLLDRDGEEASDQRFHRFAIPHGQVRGEIGANHAG